MQRLAVAKTLVKLSHTLDRSGRHSDADFVLKLAKAFTDLDQPDVTVDNVTDEYFKMVPPTEEFPEANYEAPIDPKTGLPLQGLKTRTNDGFDGGFISLKEIMKEIHKNGAYAS